MAEKKRTSDSSEDKVLDDMTNDFDDVFSEIKDKNDVESKKNQLEEESAIRGIFGRIKKKNSNQKNSLSETEKKTSSMNLSDSQEILDLSKEVTGSAKEEAVVVVKAEEESNGVTTITMKIPKLTDEKLAEIIAEQKQADMTKKKVEVNEDVLKNIIVGDIPVFGREKPKEESTEQPGTEVPLATEPAEAPSEKTVAAKPRKKKEETGSYRERYLVNIPASNRSHVYINREVAECIKRFLPVIAPNMSISGYISNILVEHIRQHWEEINELYNNEYYKPLKPF